MTVTLNYKHFFFLNLFFVVFHVRVSIFFIPSGIGRYSTIFYAFTRVERKLIKHINVWVVCTVVALGCIEDKMENNDEIFRIK